MSQSKLYNQLRGYHTRKMEHRGLHFGMESFRRSRSAGWMS